MRLSFTLLTTASLSTTSQAFKIGEDTFDSSVMDGPPHNHHHHQRQQQQERLKTAFWGMQIFFTNFLLNFLVIPPFTLVSVK
jgi:hypothetical protein